MQKSKYNSILVNSFEEFKNNELDVINNYNPNIEILYLYFNKTKTDFGNFPNLKMLYLHSCHTIDSFTNLDNLNSLFINQSSLTNILYLSNLKEFIYCLNMSDSLCYFISLYHNINGDLTLIKEK